MSKPNFVYVTYIAAPPEKVWEALTKADTRLTVVHDDFDEGSKIFGMICNGWPAVLSSLKSFLETGKALEPSWDDEIKKRDAAAGTGA
ncbi:MAG TPA: hypothetical protein VFC54_09305 [Pseudolabrys sp.]|nr:hypothetical protein [Pseudolabrys sp.]